MPKFAVFSGFLGSGKTSAMAALTQYCAARGTKAAMLSNDLGEGVLLADHRFAQLSGAVSGQITGECICFCRDLLCERLRSFYDEGNELVLCDIPGFGVGALEHVYHGLRADGADFFSLAPFTVLVEPRTSARVRGAVRGPLDAILRAQLMEADLIVLSKCDLLTPAEIVENTHFLASEFPEAQVLAVSARTGEGLDKLAEKLLRCAATLRHPKIDYDAAPLQRAMSSLSEFYLQYHALVCCNDFDGTAYLTEIAESVKEKIRAAHFEIPHLKLLAWAPEGDFGKVDLLGTDRPVEITHPFSRPCTELAVVLNASAACPPELLDAIVTGSAEEVSARGGTELTVFRKDCFGMGE